MERNKLIEKIYLMQEDVIDQIIKKIDNELDKFLQERDLEEFDKSDKKMKEIFDKYEDIYSLKISRYNEEIYKQGFIDGVKLILECYEI